ncbi:polymorphic toxin-type HINT domain-containing protein [Allosalinactinospora lopnorensis]|uniref:polymorphic toxin-type HINT domain-containing protein n=1 Tax=Allosalinactinospora lopnorensis TaxID=1352348 RepID=UPI000623C139|nr:polymorphic toxin-type HINT domain-containing protein [Allosalinactinospora lopnorensis]
MLLRIHNPDRGASFIEYSAILVLVAAMFVTVAVSGIADRPAVMISDALDRITGNTPDSASSDPGDDTSGGGGDDSSGAGDDSGGADDADGSGGDGSGGSDDDGDDGCGWNPICHGGNALDATGDGLSTAWEWTTDTAAPQVGGFFSGLGQGVWNDITGIGDIFTTNPIDTVTGMWEGIKEDPLSLVISPEAREAWSNGDYGEALGLGTWDIGSWFIPGAGWAAKAGKLGKLAPGNSRGDSSNDGNNNRDNDDNDDNNENNSGLSCPIGGSSFVPGTEVLMAGGDRVPIEAVDVGDEVWAFDPATGEEGPREVTGLIGGADEKTLVDIAITDSNGETGSVTATDAHPFWVPEAGAWVEAIDLDPGTWLRTSAGTWTQVTAVDIRTVADQQVHNLTVDDLHTYYVVGGANTALVHNQNDCTPAGPEAVDEWRQHWADEGQAYSGRRNVAVADTNIEGFENTQRAGTSGPDRPGSTPMPGQTRYNADRSADSEQKILEDIADELNPRDSNGNYPETRPDIEGSIDLYSERPPCSSCEGVIEQFEREFPNVEVNVRHG